MFPILLQSLNHGKGYYSTPYDSTVGVNKWFYLFALIIILFLVIGTFEALWNDEEWRYKYFGRLMKKSKSKNRF